MRMQQVLTATTLHSPERPHSRKKETIIGFLVIEHDVCLLRTTEGCTEILNVASNLLCSPTIINSCPSAKQRKEKKRKNRWRYIHHPIVTNSSSY